METQYQSELRKLFCEELGSIYHVESLLVRGVPRIKDSAESTDLKNFFQRHLKQAQQQVVRLQKVFKLCEKELREKKCDAMLSLMIEAKRATERWKNSPALDACLLCLFGKIVQHQVVTYQNLCGWAECLEERQILQLLAACLEEETLAAKELASLSPKILYSERQETSHK